MLLSDPQCPPQSVPDGRPVDNLARSVEKYTGYLGQFPGQMADFDGVG